MDSHGVGGSAYGTTWSESWWSVAEKAQLVNLRSENSKMVVLGSSLGWQCFLGHFHLNFSTCTLGRFSGNQRSSRPRILCSFPSLLGMLLVVALLSADPGIGYELLPSHVREARRVAEVFAPKAPVSFRCEDALEADLEDAELVWLNSYAWPVEIKQSFGL